MAFLPRFDIASRQIRKIQSIPRQNDTQPIMPLPSDIQPYMSYAAGRPPMNADPRTLSDKELREIGLDQARRMLEAVEAVEAQEQESARQTQERKQNVPSISTILANTGLSYGTNTRPENRTEFRPEFRPEFRSNLPQLPRFDPFDYPKAHKRSVSAPDFPSVSLPVPGNPVSAYTMDKSPVPAPASTRTPTPPVTPQQVCMFVPNCDLDSQLRKAISHIFGRNKTCTRKIPASVWVHYCRKHYQRNRYRNGQEWARKQCDLVLEQISRIHHWSKSNREAGQGGVVEDWELSMRKRERTRLEDTSKKQQGAPDKRHIQQSAPKHDGDSSDGDGPADNAVLTGTAVPHWLRDQVRNGYSTHEIEGIVRELKEWIITFNLSQMPDIEILPNIIMDVPGSAGLKSTLKRKSSNGSVHRRSKSEGGRDSFQREEPMSRGGQSQGRHWDPNPQMLLDKRQRLPVPQPWTQRAPAGLHAPEQSTGYDRVPYGPAGSPSSGHSNGYDGRASYASAGYDNRCLYPPTESHQAGPSTAYENKSSYASGEFHPPGPSNGYDSRASYASGGYDRGSYQSNGYGSRGLHASTETQQSGVSAGYGSRCLYDSNGYDDRGSYQRPGYDNRDSYASAEYRPSTESQPVRQPTESQQSGPSTGYDSRGSYGSASYPPPRHQ